MDEADYKDDFESPMRLNQEGRMEDHDGSREHVQTPVESLYKTDSVRRR